MMRRFCLIVCATSAFAAAPSAEQIDFFEKQVRPILVERCYECHSAEKKMKGGLALDTREAMLKGGDTGAAVVAGDPEKSLLIEAVRYTNHDLQMPPKKRLPRCGDQGAGGVGEDGRARSARRSAPVREARPRVIDIDEGRKFWSFTPLARVDAARGAERADHRSMRSSWRSWRRAACIPRRPRTSAR